MESIFDMRPKVQINCPWDNVRKRVRNPPIKTNGPTLVFVPMKLSQALLMIGESHSFMECKILIISISISDEPKLVTIQLIINNNLMEQKTHQKLKEQRHFLK